MSFILSEVMSFSIVANTWWNFGFSFCMRLFDASAMFNASMIVSISCGLSVNMFAFPVVRNCTFVC